MKHKRSRSSGSGKLLIPLIGIAAIAFAIYAITKHRATSAQQMTASYAANVDNSIPNILPPVVLPHNETWYTLNNIRPLDDWGSGFFGTLKSRGNPLASHGEFGQKNADIERNSLMVIPITVPAPPKAAQRLLIAGAGCKGNSYYGGTATGNKAIAQ